MHGSAICGMHHYMWDAPLHEPTQAAECSFGLECLLVAFVIVYLRAPLLVCVCTICSTCLFSMSNREQKLHSGFGGT
jgi:hypothetical protein